MIAKVEPNDDFRFLCKTYCVYITEYAFLVDGVMT